MSSLIEELPKILKKGKKEANQILNEIANGDNLTLQINELVIPSKDQEGYFKNIIRNTTDLNNLNQMIYGDNLLVMKSLLTENNNSPSLRGKIDLIYIDPPFDSKVDYRSKIELPGT